MKELEYRTYDELLSAVLSDFKTYDQEGLIDPQDLIKVVQSINKELTVKINQLKETTLEVSKGKVRLPNDLYLLNFGLLCDKHEVSIPVLHGMQTEDRMVEPHSVDPEQETHTPRNCRQVHEIPRVRFTACGQEYAVVQHFKYETRTHKRFLPLHIESSARVIPGCPNTCISAEKTAYLKGGWLYTNFDAGTVYLNYMGNMEDEEGNLLVLDHAIVNTYYEYALKERILENMLIEGEPVAELLKLMGMRRRSARLEARNVVFTPDFNELKEIWEINRKQQYEKYYRMFQSVPYVG